MWKGCEAIPRLSLGSNRGCRSRTNFLVRRASPTVKKPVVSLCVHTAISPRCRRLGHAFGSFVGESLQSFDQIEVSGVSRPGSSQRVGSPPTHLPERWRKATPPKLHKISVVEIWRASLCVPFAATRTRTGEVRSRTTNTSFGVQLSALAITDCRNDVVPILSV